MPIAPVPVISVPVAVMPRLAATVAAIWVAASSSLIGTSLTESALAAFFAVVAVVAVSATVAVAAGTGVAVAGTEVAVAATVAIAVGVVGVALFALHALTHKRAALRQNKDTKFLFIENLHSMGWTGCTISHMLTTGFKDYLLIP